MERLFKIASVYHTQIDGKNPADAQRPKVELTLCYHETAYSSQYGTAIRPQYVQVILLDEAATSCQLVAGQWIVASVSMMAYASNRTGEAQRMMLRCYLDRYVIVNDFSLL